jgi:hypothetical protein
LYFYVYNLDEGNLLWQIIFMKKKNLLVLKK